MTNESRKRQILDAIETLTQENDTVSKLDLYQWLGRPYCFDQNLDELVLGQQVECSVLGITDDCVRISVK